MKSKHTVIVIAVSALAGLATFILVQQVTKKGVKVSVKSASANCDDKSRADDKECQKTPPGETLKACAGKGGPSCLPELDYHTTQQGLWRKDNLAGKVVMVNLWATWCRPCIKEIPALTKAYQKHKGEGFVLLGVMIDEPSDQQLQSFALRTGLDYPVIRGTPEIFDAFERPRAVPTTFIYDRGGNLRFRHSGPVSERQLEDALAELLAEKAPPR